MPASSLNPATLFLGLEPDVALARLVLEYKERVHALVGPQTFLDHAPHLTLYLAAFGDVAAVLTAAEALAASTAPIAVRVEGWHVFWADQLTGSHTLVLKLDAAAVVSLRALQARAIGILAPLRAAAESASRYDDRREYLSPNEQASIDRTGFPYTGEHWHPHVTIASIAADDWPAIARELLTESPRLAAMVPTLTCYRIDDEQPAPFGSFALGRVGAASRDTSPLAL